MNECGTANLFYIWCNMENTDNVSRQFYCERERETDRKERNFRLFVKLL